MLFCQGIKELTSDLIQNDCTSLHINENHFQTLGSLYLCPNVETVIADDNELTENLKLPELSALHTLSLNKNQITDVVMLCDELKKKAPSLRFLSLSGNPCCPDAIYRRLDDLRKSLPLSDANGSNNDITMTEARDQPVSSSGNATLGLVSSCRDDEMDDETIDSDYQLYRMRVLYRLPKLQFLDSTMVTDAEREQAQRQGPYLDFPLQATKSSRDRKSVTSTTNNWSRKLVSEWLPKSVEHLIHPNGTKAIEDGEEVTKADEEDEDDSHYTPFTAEEMPDNLTPQQKAAFGKCRFIYYGKHSEGNRFITNQNL